MDVQNKGEMNTRIRLIQIYISFCGNVYIYLVLGDLFQIVFRGGVVPRDL